jgi:hypothetical protein
MTGLSRLFCKIPRNHGLTAAVRALLTAAIGRRRSLTAGNGVCFEHQTDLDAKCRMVLSRGLLTFATATLLITGLAGESRAQLFVPTGRDTLRGLPGIEVVVEPLQPELEQGGLSASAIRADVVRRLRAGGVTVYDSQARNPSPAKPYLYVHVNALEVPGERLYAVAIQLQLRQTVRSVVSVSQIVDAMTWDTHNILTLPAANLGHLGAEIQDYVDLFVGDWAAVHPGP